MKNIIFLVMLIFVGALASHSFAQSPKTVSPNFIRPNVIPEEIASVHNALLGIYQQLGATRYEFEHSLPAKTALVVKVTFSRNGLISQSESGTFYLTPPPEYLRNSGNFVIDRTYSTCKCPEQHNKWHLYFSTGQANYGYTFPEGTPNGYQHSSLEHINTIIGRATQQENVVFAEQDKNKKFSIVVQA